MIADFTFNEEQVELQRSARRLFTDADTLAKARQDETTESGYQRDLWSQMAELGWLGMALPAGSGGGGGSFLDAYALCEEMGRALVVGPFLDTVGIAGPLLAEDPAGRFDTQVASIADGERIVSLVAGDRFGRIDHSDIEATRQGSGWRLRGTAPLVAFASSADAFVCSARVRQGGLSGLALFLVDAAAERIEVDRVENIGALPLSSVDLDVELADDAVIAEATRGWETLYRALTKAAVLQTAYIVGAGHSVLEMANQYAKDRWQFGIPIGKNQAVQYLVSDVLIDVHTLDLLGRQAAYRIDAGLPFEREAEIAIAHGKSQAAHLHRQAHEVFAGVGFMREHPLNLFSRKSKYWENNLGDARFHYEQVARLLCDQLAAGAS